MKKLIFLVTASVMLLTATGLNAQTVASVTASKDNVIYYNNGSTTKSNGVGISLVAGNTNTANYWRRSLIKFDLPDMDSICEGATIDSVTVRLYAVKVAQGDTAHRSFSLYRLTSDWGEGTSDAADTTGKGAPATTGDATWSYNFYSSSTWITTGGGGDYSSTLSATTGLLPYTSFVAKYVYFRSSAYSQLKTDVENWLSGDVSNYGWILKGIEGSLKKSAEFRSKDYSVDSLRPKLFIYYSCSGLRSVKEIEASISSQNEGTTLSVSPSPSSSFVNISLSSGETAKVMLYSTMGTVIKTASVSTWPLSINVSGFNKGVYVVKAVSKSGTVYSNTLVKE